jgi:hypothetical protein
MHTFSRATVPFLFLAHGGNNLSGGGGGGCHRLVTRFFKVVGEDYPIIISIRDNHG